MQSHIIRFSLVLVLASGISFNGKAQESEGGIPPGILYQLGIETAGLVTLPAPDRQLIDQEDTRAASDGLPYRIAVNINTDITPEKNGILTELADGSRLWRLAIHIAGARATALYYDDFHLVPGAKFFIYDSKQTFVIGAFTNRNNRDDRRFATELIPGGYIIIELREPPGLVGSHVHINEVAFVYRGVSGRWNGQGFGNSGPCEVNINCPEGQNFQHHKRGIARILVKKGASEFWCTGSLVNNTRNDFTPYLLTADHCGSEASVQDISQWIFYFNYEGADCPDPTMEPGSTTLVGAVKLSSSGSQNSQVVESDFFLVRLNQQVPPSINPFYLGWNRNNSSFSSGVCIHHPQGDIKKISTQTTPAISTSWTSTPDTHWGVSWSQTTSGHGVTEGGSSGSPLINSQGLFMGQLSGGESSCANLIGMDYFGKFSYSWNPPGSDSTTALSYWLDPDHLNPLILNGLAPNVVYINAAFTSDRDTIVVGTTVNFFDQSFGNPVSWHWTFEGGEPPTSTEQNPSDIRYPSTGIFAVTLMAANENTSDTLTIKRFMTVIPNIFPNPFTSGINIDFGNMNGEKPEVSIHDLLGREVKWHMYEQETGKRFIFTPGDPVAGVYYLQVTIPGMSLGRKIVLLRETRD